MFQLFENLDQGFAFPWAVDHMSELEAMFESEFDYALERAT